LRREIQRTLEDPLSELLLGKVFSDSKGIKVDVKHEKFEFLPVKTKSRKISPSKRKSNEGKESATSIDS
jgi:hypothetical protein